MRSYTYIQMINDELMKKNVAVNMVQQHMKIFILGCTLSILSLMSYATETDDKSLYQSFLMDDIEISRTLIDTVISLSELFQSDPASKEAFTNFKIQYNHHFSEQNIKDISLEEAGLYLSDKEKEFVIRWYSSPEGKKLIAARQITGDNQARDLMEFLETTAQVGIPAELSEKYQKIREAIKNLGIHDMQIDFILRIEKNLSLLGGNPVLALELLWKTSSNNEGFEEKVLSSIARNLLFFFRELSIHDLNRYLEFSISPEAAKYYRLQEHIINRCFEDFEKVQLSP